MVTEDRRAPHNARAIPIIDHARQRMRTTRWARILAIMLNRQHQSVRRRYFSIEDLETVSAALRGELLNVGVRADGAAARTEQKQKRAEAGARRDQSATATAITMTPARMPSQIH